MVRVAGGVRETTRAVVGGVGVGAGGSAAKPDDATSAPSIAAITIALGIKIFMVFLHSPIPAQERIALTASKEFYEFQHSHCPGNMGNNIRSAHRIVRAVQKLRENFGKPLDIKGDRS